MISHLRGSPACRSLRESTRKVRLKNFQTRLGTRFCRLHSMFSRCICRPCDNLQLPCGFDCVCPPRLFAVSWRVKIRFQVLKSPARLHSRLRLCCIGPWRAAIPDCVSLSIVALKIPFWARGCDFSRPTVFPAVSCLASLTALVILARGVCCHAF